MSLVLEKVEQAAGILRELGVDCWLTFVRESTETGDPVLPLILGRSLTWQSALLITRASERLAIVGKYEDDVVRATGAWPQVQPYVQSIRGPLVAALDRLRPRSLAVNFSVDDVKADGLSHGLYLLLQEYLKETPHAAALTSAADIIRALRGRKTAGEVDRIRAAVRSTEELFQMVGDSVRAGWSEADIAAFMHRQARSRGLGTAWDEAQCPIVTTGPESMVGHGVPSTTLRVTPGGILHIDFGVRQDEYCADLQRCWYVPAADEDRPPAAVERAFKAVAAAIRAGAAALKPGVECWTVDAAARRSLTDAGYPEYQHATGHHVGRAAHDGGGVLGPRWERYGRTPSYTVETGNVFTLELGIDDVDGRGYLGLEEMVLVTESGCEWLTAPQTALPLLG